MAVDEMLFESCMDMPVLRLYGWEPSLSIGRYTRMSEPFSGMKIVRRISGGGILLHGGDLSYSLVIPRTVLNVDGVKESYRYLSRFILRVYEKLSVASVFASDSTYSCVQSEICMAGKEEYDIVFNGFKLGGHAQRHSRERIFQHGSIPMDFDDVICRRLFGTDSEGFGITSLNRLNRHVEYDQLADIVKQSFCETFDVSLYEQGFSLSEANRAGELYESKYLNERWNLYGE